MTSFPSSYFVNAYSLSADTAYSLSADTAYSLSADVALNQRPLKIETRPWSLVQRLEMSVKYLSAPAPFIFRTVHRTEILTL